VKVKIVNYSNSKIINDILKDEGFACGSCPDLNEEQIMKLIQLFSFEKDLNVKILPRISSEEQPFLISLDTLEFAPRTLDRNKCGKKVKEKALHKFTKEFGTKKYPVEEVLPHVVKRKGMKPVRIEFDGDPIKVNSLRLMTFKMKGCTCVTCGLEGTYFLKERGKPTENFHFNLFGDVKTTVDGEEIIERRLFTKDHIHPKSKGGADSLENMQTMCSNCNSEKGNKVDEES
jgi:hypothetical protein